MKEITWKAEKARLKEITYHGSGAREAAIESGSRAIAYIAHLSDEMEVYLDDQLNFFFVDNGGDYYLQDKYKSFISSEAEYFLRERFKKEIREQRKKFNYEKEVVYQLQEAYRDFNNYKASGKLYGEEVEIIFEIIYDQEKIIEEGLNEEDLCDWNKFLISYNNENVCNQKQCEIIQAF